MVIKQLLLELMKPNKVHKSLEMLLKKVITMKKMKKETMKREMMTRTKRKKKKKEDSGIKSNT